MRIQQGCLVQLDYAIYGTDGDLLERSDADEPLVYMHGDEQTAPGLEAALEGREVGAKLDLTLEPADAFGEIDPEEQHSIPRSDLPEGLEVQVGDMLPLLFEPEEGDQPGALGEDDFDEVEVRVVEIDADSITVDLNHPYAGRTLRFVVEVLAVDSPE
jgi:FKBP-type peptidyl-prolyl cis-trans isomerase SlyD